MKKIIISLFLVFSFVLLVGALSVEDSYSKVSEPSYYMKYQVQKQDSDQGYYTLQINPESYENGVIYYKICHEINTLQVKDKGGKILYSVPSKMSYYATDLLVKKPDLSAKYFVNNVQVSDDFLLTPISEVSLSEYVEGNPVMFCVGHLNPYVDKYLKFGENSTVVISYNTSTGSSIYANWSMSVDGGLVPQSMKHHFNDTNYTFYDDNLKLFLNFNNRSEIGENRSIVRDLSKYQNNGTISASLNWSSNGGIYNGGFVYGINSSAGNYKLITLGSYPISNYTPNWTFSAWIYPYNSSSYTTDGQHIINLYGTYDGWIHYKALLGGYVYAVIRNGTDQTPITQLGAIPLGNWFHVVLVKNQINSSFHNFTWYVNGELNKNNYVLGSIFNTTNQPLTIGGSLQYPQLNYRSYNGSIDDLMVWNRSLSQDEVKRLYGLQITKYDSANWSYAINETGLSPKTYSAFACVTNSTGSEVCSTTKTYDVGCMTPSNGRTISGTTTFCTGTYYLNGSSDGAIQINSGSNYVVDCNNSVLVGNGTSETIGIHLFRLSNVSLKNCNLVNYVYGLKVTNSSGNVDNFTLTNNTHGILLRYGGLVNGSIISNSTFTGQVNYDIWSYGSLDNLTIKNNRFFNNRTYSSINFKSNGSNVYVLNNLFNTSYEGVREESGNTINNLYIDNNTFNQFTTRQAISGYYGLGWNISNNRFVGAGVGVSYNTYTENDNLLFYNNNFSRSQYSASIVRAYNVTLRNNLFENVDQGGFIFSSDLVYYENNTIENATVNYDGYDLGIKIKNSSNVYVRYNNFSKISSTAVLVQSSDSIFINGNYFYTIPIIERVNYSAKDYGDPVCAISVVELYKSYLGNGDEGTDYDMDLSVVGNYYSDSVSLSSNVFDNNTQCYLRTEGTTNLLHDLSNYWYRKFNTPTYLKDVMEFWINTNYSNLSSYYGSPASVQYNMTSTFFGKNKMLYQVLNDSLKFYNVNNSDTYETIFYDINGYSCVDGCSFELEPYESYYIYDDFILNVSSSYENSPITMDPMINNFTTIHSFITSGVAVNVSLVNYPNSFYVVYPNGSVNYMTVLDPSNFALYLPYGDTYINSIMYADIRVKDSRDIVYYSSICGHELDAYSLLTESGCNGYDGDTCEGLVSTFSDVYDYEILQSDYNYSIPTWSDGNICLFTGTRYTNSSERILVQAWRVYANGGQYCTMADEWNWFVYTPDSSIVYNSTLNSEQYQDLPDYLDFSCFYTGDGLDPTDDTNETFPQFFDIDFTNWFNIILFLLVLALAVWLMFMGWFVFAGAIILLLGFVLLFSGISIFYVCVFIVVAGLIILIVNNRR